MTFSRFITLSCLFLSLSSCQSIDPGQARSSPRNGRELPSSDTRKPSRAKNSAHAEVRSRESNAANQKILPVRARTLTLQGKDYTLSFFDSRQYQLILADSKKGPGAAWSSAREAADNFGGLAAINGGFFTPEGAPLGELASQGRQRGHNNTSSLGAGFFSGGARPELLTRAEFQKKRRKPANYLQTGPRLVWNGKTRPGLSSQKPRARSFLAWDGKNHWLIGQVDSATLSGLADDLARGLPSGFSVRYALNLDGGSSSDLWISAKIPGGPLSEQPWFHKAARNYLILKKRRP